MKTLPLQIRDKEYLEELHKKYGYNFPFPEFAKNFIATFKILDDNGKLITAGGVKLFPELILITDEEMEQRKRYNAMIVALQISQFSARLGMHDSLFASADADTEWEGILKKIGFQEAKDHNLVIY